MGAVFLAVRDDDQFHKEVAIKTLKFELESELGDRAVPARAADPRAPRAPEHRAAARRRHDRAGHAVHRDGVRRGRADHRVVRRSARLSIEDRLRLFRHVCDAVQYAHQHLVVHRDIKPANILVTADGVPKLLDFGIAKLLDAECYVRLRTSSAATATGALLMTPDYASPEQVRGEPVSTATDVYSLGAVLYELLTGQRPHAFAAPIRSRCRAICDTDIRPPSTHGNRRLRGDLDTIVLRAMQKEPARRYASAAELSEDVRRHLDGPADRRARGFGSLSRDEVRSAASRSASPRRPRSSSVSPSGVAVSVHEARVAQRRFDQVRELANTFLFQFYDQVTPLPGSTAVRVSIVDTARKYLDGLSKEAAGDRNLTLEVAQAYQRLGNVQNGESWTTGRRATQLSACARSVRDPARHRHITA